MRATFLRKYWSSSPYLTALVVGLGARLILIPFLYHEWMDPFVLEHWAFGRVGRSLALGHGFGSPFADTGPSALLPPVYCYLLAGIFKILGVYTRASIMAALAINSVFSALTCIPVYRIAQRCLGDRTAKWATWLWALSPYGVYYGGDWAWSTCLATLILAWLFLMALNLPDTGRTSQWIGFGLLAGIGILVEPVLLSPVALLGVWALYRVLRRAGDWKMGAVAAVLSTMVVVAPWIARNYATFHKFIPVRSGYGLELYIGNNGYSQHWVNRSLHPNHSDSELSEYVQRGEVAYMEHKRQQAMAFIQEHRGWYLWMSLRRATYLWTGYWSLARAYLAEEPLDPPNIFVATTMTVLAFTGLWRLFRRRFEAAIPFALVIAVFPLPYYLSHPETYYLRPLDPLLIVLIAYTCTRRRATDQDPVAG